MRFLFQSFYHRGDHRDLGHPGFQAAKIENLCRELNVPFHLVKTEIAPIIFQERKESNPCSLCAKSEKAL